jgi:4,5-dihydroxyphthalate decarboxylase
MNKPFTRRGFLSGAATSLAFAAASSVALGQGSAKRPIKLRGAGYRFPRTEALFTGAVNPPGIELQFEVAGIGDMNTNVFSGEQTWDVCEIGLHPFMLAYANEDFRDYSLIPAYPIRAFRHKSIFVRTDRGIQKPEDLKGRTVATPGYSSTSLTWIRGMLKDEYGVEPGDIDWVYSRKDSSAAEAGKISAQENVLPEGVSIRPGPLGKDESQLLVDGDVDALFHAAQPQAFIDGHPKVARLFADSRATEQDYYRRTGIFPIMHAVAVRKKLLDADDTLAGKLFRAYSEAKQRAYLANIRMGWASNMLPWYSQELEATQAVMGSNFYSYGLPENRVVLDTLFRYSHDQGLASKRLTVEELFHPSALALTEQTG